MRTMHRAAAVVALGLPLLLVGPGMALAHDGHHINFIYEPVFLVNNGHDQSVALSNTLNDYDY